MTEAQREAYAKIKPLLTEHFQGSLLLARVRDPTGAAGIILITHGGIFGEGSSAQLSGKDMLRVPQVLRDLAEQIEADFKRELERFQTIEQPPSKGFFITLTLPNGKRVSGEVNAQLPNPEWVKSELIYTFEKLVKIWFPKANEDITRPSPIMGDEKDPSRDQ